MEAMSIFFGGHHGGEVALGFGATIEVEKGDTEERGL